VSTASRSAAFAGTAGSSRAMWPKMDICCILSDKAIILNKGIYVPFAVSEIDYLCTEINKMP